MSPADEGVELWDFGFEPGTREVDVVCGTEQPAMQLGVQFTKPTDATSRGANLIVTYDSEGGRGTLRIAFQLILCESDDEDECGFWPMERYEDL